MTPIKLLKKSFHPRKLFVVDAVGAILSAIMLGIVLVRFKTYFGIPVRALYFLAVFPVLFVFYDIYSLLNNQRSWSKKLIVIAWANLMYCLISLVVLLFHAHAITALGTAYLIGEILIIILLAAVEFRTAKKLAKASL